MIYKPRQKVLKAQAVNKGLEFQKNLKRDGNWGGDYSDGYSTNSRFVSR